MAGISIHVVDVSRGVVAAGMGVAVIQRLAGQERLLAEGVIGANGLLDHPALQARFSPCAFDVTFHVAAYYRSAGVPLPEPPFLDIVRYSFAIAEPDQHYHLPMKLTPWGYSCFRGGA